MQIFEVSNNFAISYAWILSIENEITGPLFLLYEYNLISGLHSFMSEKNAIYKNVLPPLKILSKIDKKELLSNLDKLDFNIENLKAA